MKELLIALLLAVPAAAYTQDQGKTGGAQPDLPGIDMKAEAADSGPVQRPDTRVIMSDLTETLQLSSKQEERISSAVTKKAKEFDSLMKDYEESSENEKKWRYKMNEARYKMSRINRDMPDTVRDFLDDNQRQNYDSMLEARNKPLAPEKAEAAQGQPAAEVAAPVKKRHLVRRLVRRKKVKPEGAAAGTGAPDGASAVADTPDGSGQVMVDKDTGAAKPAVRRKKRVLRKKPAAEEPPADNAAAPAGAAPAGSDAAPAAADDSGDAGSYP
jgi:hypothetical protein